jgi:hypothetical protein
MERELIWKLSAWRDFAESQVNHKGHGEADEPGVIVKLRQKSGKIQWVQARSRLCG